jgi:hypothetical protein
MSKTDPWAWLQPDERQAHYEFDADYTDTPYLTALVNAATTVGTFIGVFTAIGLAYQWHKGIGDYWVLILILVLDVAINVGARVTRRHRRHALGPTATGHADSGDELAPRSRPTSGRAGSRDGR